MIKNVFKVSEMINIEDCERGYILKGIENHKEGGHFIVFFDQYNYPDFIGAMISTKNPEFKNILMKEIHFDAKLPNGSDSKVVFNNSHLVKAKLHKYHAMGPFELCGNLSEQGVDFLIKNIDDSHLENWDEYFQRTN